MQLLPKNPSPVDDELHFIFDCSFKEQLRSEIFSNHEFLKPNINNSSEDEKIGILKSILNNPEKVNELKSFAEFLYKSEIKRNNQH